MRYGSEQSLALAVIFRLQQKPEEFVHHSASEPPSPGAAASLPDVLLGQGCCDGCG